MNLVSPSLLFGLPAAASVVWHGSIKLLLFNSKIKNLVSFPFLPSILEHVHGGWSYSKHLLYQACCAWRTTVSLVGHVSAGKASTTSIGCSHDCLKQSSSAEASHGVSAQSDTNMSFALPGDLTTDESNSVTEKRDPAFRVFGPNPWRALKPPRARRQRTKIEVATQGSLICSHGKHDDETRLQKQQHETLLMFVFNRSVPRVIMHGSFQARSRADFFRNRILDREQSTRITTNQAPDRDSGPLLLSGVLLLVGEGQVVRLQVLQGVARALGQLGQWRRFSPDEQNRAVTMLAAKQEDTEILSSQPEKIKFMTKIVRQIFCNPMTGFFLVRILKDKSAVLTQLVKTINSSPRSVVSQRNIKHQ